MIRQLPVKSSAPPKLFLRVNDGNEGLLRRAEALAGVFVGPIPVVVYDERTGEKRRMPRTVSDDELLLSEMRRLMGDENVVLRQ